jgi:hypothetical protein
MIEGVSDDFRYKVIRYAVSYSLLSKAIQAVLDREVTCLKPQPSAERGLPNRLPRLHSHQTTTQQTCDERRGLRCFGRHLGFESPKIKAKNSGYRCSPNNKNIAFKTYSSPTLTA